MQKWKLDFLILNVTASFIIVTIIIIIVFIIFFLIIVITISPITFPIWCILHITNTYTSYSSVN